MATTTKTDITTEQVGTTDMGGINGTGLLNTPLSPAVQAIRDARAAAKNTNAVATDTTKQEAQIEGTTPEQKTLPTESQTKVDSTSALTEPTPDQRIIADGKDTGLLGGKTKNVSGVTKPEALVDNGVIKKEETTATTEGTSTPTKTTETNKPTVPATEDEAFAIMQNGGTLPYTRETAVWANRYKNYQGINAMDATSIAQMMADGDIAPSSVDLLRKYSPQKYAEIEKAYNDNIAIDGLNKTSRNIFDIIGDIDSFSKLEETGGEKTKSELIQEQLIKDFNSTPPSIRDLKNKYYEGNDDMKESRIRMGELEANMNDTKDEISRIYQTFREQYPDAPQALIIGMAERASYDLNQKLTRETREYNLEYSKYQANKEDLDMELKFDEMLMKEEQTNRTERMNFLQNLYTGAKADEDWQRSADFEMDKIKDAQAYGDQKAEQEHKWRLEEIKNAQAFQSNESALQRDQAWKIVEMQMKNAGKEIVDKGVDSNGAWVQTYDKNTGKSEKVYSSDVAPSRVTEVNGGKNNVTIGTDSQGSYMDIDVPNGVINDGRDQCGMKWNDILDREKPVGDSYDSKAQWIDKQIKTPRPGDGFVSNIGVQNGKIDNGHIGFVSRVFPDGRIEVKDANAIKDPTTGKGVWSTRVIGPGDPIFDSITGYIPTKFSQSTGGKNMNQMSAEDRARVDLATGAMVQYSKSKEKGMAITDNINKAIEVFGVGSPEVKGQIESYLDAVEGNGVGKVMMGIDRMDAIMSDIEAYKKANPNGDLFSFKGNVDSKIEQLNNSLSAKDISPETRARIQLEQKILSTMQEYRRSMTGAAASILEGTEYTKLFPKGSSGSDVAMAQLEGFKNMIERDYRTKLYSITGGKQNYDAMMGKPPESEKNVPTFSSMGVDSKFFTSDNAKAASFLANPTVMGFLNLLR